MVPTPRRIPCYQSGLLSPPSVGGWGLFTVQALLNVLACESTIYSFMVYIKTKHTFYSKTVKKNQSMKKTKPIKPDWRTWLSG